MFLNQRLVDAAIEQAVARFPQGSGGAAALATRDGRILASVCFESFHPAVSLCHETGAMCEAYRLGCEVTASVCVSRDSETEPFVILPPCGICQERLAFWGQEVEVAVPVPGQPGQWRSLRLAEVQPYFWHK